MYISELFDGKLSKTDTQNIAFDKNYDVIVCGLGTAGSMAALMSAENGLSTLGIESFNCVGGTTTIGGVQSHYFGCPGGRYTKIDYQVNAFQKKHTRNQIESRKYVVENLITDNGGEILYESSVCGVYFEENTVIGVKVITPDGIKHFGSKVIMDCTGDAYVAHMAGCTSEYGRKIDGLSQPYSMVSTTRNGTAVGWTNRDFGRVDQYNDKDLTQALIFSRSYNMQEERDGKALMLHMPLIGVREGKHIHCEETVTLESILQGKKTETPMFYSYADFDKHGWDNAFDGEILGDWSVGSNLGAYNATVPVPYKSIIPKDLDGLLVPCRALGVDRDIGSCVRMVLDMKKIGEAGADIALLAIKHNCRLRDIPYDELCDMLQESGCLDHSFDRGFRVDGFKKPNGEPFDKRDVKFIDDPSLLQEHLSTDTPGEAIWSAKLMGKKAIPTLIKLLSSDDENTRKHAAFALANAGDDSGKDVLIKTVLERDEFTLNDCRKNNQQRGYVAIYWLGRLKCKEATDILTSFITNPKETELPHFAAHSASDIRYRIGGFNNRYFQYLLNSVMALIRIGDAHPDLREKIAEAFIKAFDDDTYYSRVTSRPKLSSEGSMIINVKNVAYRTVERWKVK